MMHDYPISYLKIYILLGVGPSVGGTKWGINIFSAGATERIL